MESCVPCCGRCVNFLEEENRCSVRGTRHTKHDTGKAACLMHFEEGRPKRAKSSADNTARRKGEGFGDYRCSFCDTVVEGTPSICPCCHRDMY